MRHNLDRKFYKKYQYLVGVDEVGRGPLCGPVVACACILPKNYKNSEIDDSKKLSKKKREKLFEILKKDCLEYSFGVVEAPEIDEINILNATRKAMTMAIKNLKTKFDLVLVDCMEFPNEGFKYESFIKGDANSQSIASASILAKVFRDNIMAEWDNKFPEYGFVKNNGYGTKQHIEAIKENGIIPRFHRESFYPVSEFRKKINKKIK